MTFASRSRVLYLALRRFNHSNNKSAAYIYVFSTFWAFCNGEKKKKKINNFPPQKTRSNPIGNIFVGNIFHERERRLERNQIFPVRHAEAWTRTKGRKEERKKRNGAGTLGVNFPQPEQQQHRKDHWRAQQARSSACTHRKKNLIQQSRERNRMESIGGGGSILRSPPETGPLCFPTLCHRDFGQFSGLSSIEDFNSAIPGADSPTR